MILLQRIVPIARRTGMGGAAASGSHTLDKEQSLEFSYSASVILHFKPGHRCAVQTRPVLFSCL